MAGYDSDKDITIQSKWKWIYVVTMAKSNARKDPNYDLFVETLNRHSQNADIQYLCRKMKPMMFPSDQVHFKKGIGVCALRKSPFGLYCARIHTPFDTKCRKENIEFLAIAMKEFIENLEQSVFRTESSPNFPIE